MQGYIPQIAEPQTLRGFSDIYSHLDLDTDDRVDNYDNPSRTTYGIIPASETIQNQTLTQSNFLDCSPSVTNEDLTIENFIFLIRTIPEMRVKEDIVKRLFYLNNVAKDDGDCSGISLNSLIVFYKLISAYPNIKKPSITLTPDYYIFISWKENNDKIVNLHLKSFESIDFLIFSNDDMYNNVNRISGSVSINTINEILLQNNTKWIFD
ncbi:MAG: hypothetical protein HQ521_03275 [Bacteroidetes bacterium]|nr:hypothetical protein [Bacteroidota bacterium]